MRLWVDDCRTPPVEGEWICLKTVNGTIDFLNRFKGMNMIELISLDHDAGDFAKYGGDYIKILDWLEEKQVVDGWQIDWLFNIHSQNPIGVEKMEQIIRKNGWRML